MTEEPTAKKPWAFQIKHPRREGTLLFAAENGDEYQRWKRAFQSAASIQVQSVNTMEEIRITDLELQQRWHSLEKDFPAHQNGGHRVESTSNEVQILILL